jgi:hypothetical protein
LQDDGNLVNYAKDPLKAVWASNSVTRCWKIFFDFLKILKWIKFWGLFGNFVMIVVIFNNYKVLFERKLKEIKIKFVKFFNFLVCHSLYKLPSWKIAKLFAHHHIEPYTTKTNQNSAKNQFTTKIKRKLISFSS